MASPRLSAFRSDLVLRQAGEPTFWLDKSLRIVWVNRAWEALTGCPAERVLGLVCKAHAAVEVGVAADLAAAFHPPMEATAGRPASAPTVVLNVHGEKLWRRLDFWPFHDDQGGLIGILGRVRGPDQPEPESISADQTLHEQLLAIRWSLDRAHGIDRLVGRGDAHDRLLVQIRLAAGTSAPVLIRGESGAGKRLIARTIHESGADREAPIHFIDSEALPAGFLEQRLFGPRNAANHRPGAVGAAVGDRLPSRTPNRPTIAVGDVLLLPRDVQAELSAMLRSGSGPRLLAMTSGDPEEALRSERLRPDLYYALTPLCLRLPPLRERREELLLLAQHFLERLNRRDGPQRLGFAASAQAVLAAYDWPGNLTELDRVVRHAHDRAEEPLITADDLPASIQGNLGAAHLPGPSAPPVKPLDELLTEIERRLIETALARARRNKSRAADLLGISRPRLYRRMKELNLDGDAESDDDSGPAPPPPPG